MPALPAFEADRWMDNEEASAHGTHSFRGFINPALQAPRRLADFAGTTPGILTLVSTILVLAILAAGGAMALSSTARQDDLNTLVTRTEPLSNAAQDMFNSLSVADSVATTGFLQTGFSDSKPDKAYQDAIQDASSAIVRATSGIDNIESREMELVLHVQNRLPEYVRLVAQAQTNNRVQNPVGAAYLTQASTLMQDEILPAARELYSRTSSLVSQQQANMVKPMWFPLSGLVAAVIMLILAQLWLAAWTNRRINVGYCAATVLMVVALLFAGINAALTWHSGAQGVQGTVDPLESLTDARISAQQARTDEALGLVQRNYDSSTQSAFSSRVAKIDQTLDSLRDQVSSPQRIDAAREALRGWDTAHAQMVSQIQAGNYDSAYNIAVGTQKENATGTNFENFDQQLQKLITQTRTELRDVLLAGRIGAERTATAVFILTLIAAACTIAGTRPRLQEFL
ncbi:hypothetical protein [Corynebacterium heidelbergense]|uniref:Chemotaxis methyl-accepting receptor HlyB-like 4HB MCP domain-containing protein n=1 Tax=Corynebacterium heidelbergense TaxID=2055947 RepID=A0A364VC14_9CORY|nr:hypothetical protein [Corynebacterium heidelbergense]RAV34189.1 hypothetical protein CWC39_04605 [Corynebacterium heidelbergense]